MSTPCFSAESWSPTVTSLSRSASGDSPQKRRATQAAPVRLPGRRVFPSVATGTGSYVFAPYGDQSNGFGRHTLVFEDESELTTPVYTHRVTDGETSNGRWDGRRRACRVPRHRRLSVPGSDDESPRSVPSGYDRSEATGRFRLTVGPDGDKGGCSRSLRHVRGLLTEDGNWRSVITRGRWKRPPKRRSQRGRFRASGESTSHSRTSPVSPWRTFRSSSDEGTRADRLASREWALLWGFGQRSCSGTAVLKLGTGLLGSPPPTLD